MKFAEYIAKRIPVSAEFKSEIKHDRHGVPFFRLTYADIQLPAEISTGFKRMYHSADISSVKEGGFSVVLYLRWETFQGGNNGVMIFNEFIE